MSFIIGAITLPRFPEEIKFRKAADKKTLRYPSNRPIILVYGKKVDVLSIEGRLQATGQTKANLVTNFINTLEGYIGTEQTIQNAGRSYHNTAFICVDFVYDERPGSVRTFYFKMEFWKGDIHIVI